MLSLEYIRSNPDEVQESADLQDTNIDVEKILRLDEERRDLQYELDQKRHRRNEGSERVSELKKKGEDASDLIEELRSLGEEIQEGEEELRSREEELERELQNIPNIPADDVPEGADEEDNVELRREGKKATFDFAPDPHWEVGENLGIIDFERTARMSGSGFYSLTGDGARLERGLMNWMLDYHTRKKDYTEVQVPLLTRSKAPLGAGQLPKLEGDMYQTRKDDLYLIPTSEVPLINLHREEILDEEELPLCYTAGSACFRREAGAAGSETRGMTRVHQFNKVELVKIVKPGEGTRALENMLSTAEEILRKLGLHYRILTLCTGDLSFASRKTYDIEVWAPGSGRWLEVSSVSTCTDFQSRRAGIRYRDEEGETRYPHTLNGSGVALPRTMIALLETYQQSDGSVELPDVLSVYMNGLERLD